MEPTEGRARRENVSVWWQAKESVLWGGGETPLSNEVTAVGLAHVVLKDFKDIT